jgi:hypothetical protein
MEGTAFTFSLHAYEVFLVDRCHNSVWFRDLTREADIKEQWSYPTEQNLRALSLEKLPLHSKSRVFLADRYHFRSSFAKQTSYQATGFFNIQVEEIIFITSSVNAYMYLHKNHISHAPIPDKTLLHVPALKPVSQWNGFNPLRMQSKIPPIRTPKDTEQISSPRCAMEDSFCQLVIFELRKLSRR